jgi:hypothetical protein
MSSVKRTSADRFKALRKAVADEVLSMTDEEILTDARDQGLDPDHIALMMRTKALEAIASIRKQKLKNVRETLNLAQTKTIERPTTSFGIEEKKKRIMAFLSEPDTNFSLAFRNGEKQSDSDWDTLWDDLIEQGLIKDEHSGD